MSHSAVLIIGDDPETMLAPFDENLEECEQPRWDWYELGGRWSDYFLLKNGHKSSQSRKEHINFEGMKKYNYGEALVIIRRVLSKVESLDIEQYLTWNTLYNNLPKDPTGDMIQNARDVYHSQPLVAALKDDMPWSADPVEHYELLAADPETAFAEKMTISWSTPFAILSAEGWMEKGEMGWFGIVHDELDPKEWQYRAWNIMNAAPDYSLFSMYDLHI